MSLTQRQAWEAVIGPLILLETPPALSFLREALQVTGPDEGDWSPITAKTPGAGVGAAPSGDSSQAAQLPRDTSLPTSVAGGGVRGLVS